MQIQDSKKEQEKLKKKLKGLPATSLFLFFGSTLARRSKGALKNIGGKVTGFFTKTREEVSTRGAEKVKPEIKGLKEGLRSIKSSFSPPRPEITVFMLGEEIFHPYSTSEQDEQRSSSYFTYLASIYSAGRNIDRYLATRSSSLPKFSLKDGVMYSLFPVLDENILYIGKIEGDWLFSIKSEKFPKERFNPPEDRVWREHTRNGTKLIIDQQLDFLLRHEEIYSQLSEFIKISYHTGVEKLKSLQKGENFAIYLLRTPHSQLSPFITLRVEKGNEGVESHIFPVWFDYEELRLIRTAKKIQEVWKELKRSFDKKFK